MTYAEAMAQIESILDRLQRAELTVDHLAADAPPPPEPLPHGRARLHKAEEEVGKILQEP